MLRWPGRRDMRLDLTEGGFHPISVRGFFLDAGDVKNNILLSALLCAVVVSATLVTGCASANYNKSAGTAAALSESSAMIDKGGSQIDDALNALNDLVAHPQPDLRAQYQAYSVAVDALDNTAKDVAHKNTAMKEQGTAYFAEWDSENATMRNENIRQRSEARQAEVASHFVRIGQQYKAARIAFAPFMSDLRDVQKFLANDLTAGGLAAIKEVAAKAAVDAVPVKDSLMQLSTEFKGLSNSMAYHTAVN